VNDEVVRAVVMQRARNRERAREAIEEAVSWSGRQPEGKVADYNHYRRRVMKVARNYLVEDSRRSRRQRQLLAQVAAPARAEDAGAEERREVVRQALETPEDGGREMVRRSFEEGCTSEQRAEELGRTTATAYDFA
jgi:hypothetical protein